LQTDREPPFSPLINDPFPCIPFPVTFVFGGPQCSQTVVFFPSSSNCQISLRNRFFFCTVFPPTDPLFPHTVPESLRSKAMRFPPEVRPVSPIISVQTAAFLSVRQSPPLFEGYSPSIRNARWFLFFSKIPARQRPFSNSRNHRTFFSSP